MPIDITQLPQLVEALSTVAAILERLGLPGLLVLLVSGPAAVIVTLLYINHANSRNLALMHEQARRDTQELVAQARSETFAVLEAYRTDTQELIAQTRREMSSVLEAYRTDTQNILQVLGENQRVTAQYYKDNVELVKGYKHMADDFSDLIVSNTAALQRVAGLVENNMNCPAVRETVRGKK